MRQLSKALWVLRVEKQYMRTSPLTIYHVVGLRQCSSCFPSHKGADCWCPSTALSSSSHVIFLRNSWNCAGRHSWTSCNVTYECAILEKLEYLCDLNELHVPSHTTSSYKNTSRKNTCSPKPIKSCPSWAPILLLLPVITFICTRAAETDSSFGDLGQSS